MDIEDAKSFVESVTATSQLRLPNSNIIANSMADRVRSHRPYQDLLF
jgi:hypothetical protein